MIIFIEDIRAPNLFVTRNFAWILKVSKVTMYVNNFKKREWKKYDQQVLNNDKNNKVITKIIQFKTFIKLNVAIFCKLDIMYPLCFTGTRKSGPRSDGGSLPGSGVTYLTRALSVIWLSGPCRHRYLVKVLQ